MENQTISGFVEKQHEEKAEREAAKRLRGPSDCHKTFKIMPDGNFLQETYHPCFINPALLIFGIRSQYSHQSRSFFLTSMFMRSFKLQLDVQI
jgi:hypothetical protein